MEQIQFIGINPKEFKDELIKEFKDELLQDLEKKINSKEPNLYYTAKQICDRFSISKPTLHEWRNKGIVETYRLGGKVFFRLDQIESAMTTSKSV